MSKRPIHITKYATLEYSFTFHQGYKYMKDLPVVRDGKLALAMLQEYFRKHCSFVQEHFVVMYLNYGHRPLAIATISTGTAQETVVDIPHILRIGITIGAYCLIISHNHVSGGIEPSNADKSLTKKLSSACKAVDIKLLDHFIISDHPESWYSFENEGTL